MHLICRLHLRMMCLHKQSYPLIFTYHSIASGFHVGLNIIHPDKFRKHVQYIANINRSTQKDKHISIAFDDGYESVYANAFTIMEEYSLKGIVFPISGYIGKTNDWDVTFGVNKTMHLTKSLVSLETNIHLVAEKIVVSFRSGRRGILKTNKENMFDVRNRLGQKLRELTLARPSGGIKIHSTSILPQTAILDDNSTVQYIL